MKLRDAYPVLEAQLKTDPTAALCGFVALSAAAPQYHAARFRVVDALLTLGDIDAAANLLETLAVQHAHRGEPTQAILACKLLESMGRDSDRAASEIAMIYAGLHGQELVAMGAPVDVPDLEMPAPLSLAAAHAALPTISKLADVQPDRYPALPLLSRLSPEDFIIVLRAMKLHRVGTGARIVTQGAEGASCFLVCEGTLVVSRQIGNDEKALSRLHPGTIFGEMALVSRRPRNASITALGSATVLELTKATLLAHSKAMRDALYLFTRRRLLENISLTSPMLQPLKREARQAVVGLFGSFPIEPGTPLVKEGESGQGLYVVLRGAVRVTKKTDGGEIELAVLHEGDLFGEISLLRDTPTTASVVGHEEGEVLFLDKGDFHAVTDRFPEVAAALAALTEERLRTSELILENVDDLDALSLI